jgi:hypothetical protein
MRYEAALFDPITLFLRARRMAIQKTDRPGQNDNKVSPDTDSDACCHWSL